VATVSNAASDNNGGLAQALAAGTTTITAAFGAVSGSTILTVTAPVLQSIAVTTPITSATTPNPSYLSLSTVTFTATGTYSDGTTPDITSQVTWASSNTNVAPIPDSTGVTQTITQGTTNITASLNGIIGTTTLNVTGGTLTPFPALTNMTVVNGTSVPISVTGNFGNGIARDITGALAWSVDNTNIANVTTVSGNRVLIKGLAPGTTTIRATSPGSAGQVSTATLTVTNPALQTNGFTISLNTQNLTAGTSGNPGTSTRLTATAAFSDNTTQDVTADLVLTSNAPAIASVGSVGPGGTFVQGGIPIITAQTVGTTSIAAQFIFGSLTVNLVNPIPVTVVARSLQSITIGVPSTGVTVGNQSSFTASANYNNATIDVTDIATWSIDNPNIAILADPQNQPGQVVGVSSGTMNLTATFNGQSQTLPIKVP
jgi:hypothetical protein